MSAPRPTVSAQLIAAMIESTPDRVRRRLDQSPGAAATWNWQASEENWSIDTGGETDGETVTLSHGQLVAVEQLACTCLLSPRCFHVLACLTRLEVAIADSGQAQPKEHEPNEQVADDSTDAREDVAEPSEKQQLAARELVSNLCQLLRVGIANAGVVMQSGLLRAVHQCRADGLHRLSALGLKVIAGINEFRQRAPSSDPSQLADDIADALETGHRLLGQQPIESFWFGTARRKQMPVRPRRLHGLFAEPIITRSGFCGAAAYFLGEDDRIYTASDVRPGDAGVRDAYLGGIEIGSMIQPAKQLARSLYLGTDLTASQDGRLGRGKGIKIVEQGASTWQFEALQERFRRPLPDQWSAVYTQAALPLDARSAGWDFVFIEGTVLGAVGPELLFQPTTHSQPVRLAIENESASLRFRENLRMLSHAPGLRLQAIARMNLHEPRIVSPLAVTPSEDSENKDAPRMEIPTSWAGRICLGFDEIQRPMLINAQASAVILSLHSLEQQQENPLSSLRRRWIATMLAGLVSQRPTGTNRFAAERFTLKRAGFATAAALLDALSRSNSDAGATGYQTFLATAVYLRSCGHELARSRAMLEG